MADSMELDLGRRSRRLRVDTLIRLRWLALCGQTIAVLLVHYGFGFPIPLGLCLLVIAHFGVAEYFPAASLRPQRPAQGRAGGFDARL